jgi:hypothetical protein
MSEEMKEDLRTFCLQHRIHFEEEPQPLAPSRQTWQIKDILGKYWVVKSKAPEDTTFELLKNLATLHPPFHFPQPVSDPEGPFLLYPYIQGRLLAEDDFDGPQVIEQVMEVIGRVQAAVRSMVMVPFYQDALGLKSMGGDGLDRPPERLSFTRIQGTSEQQRAARHREMAESYHWTESRAQSCCDVLQSHGLWPQAPFEEYRERIHRHFALHLPIAGPNLSHTALHPEHLLSCPDGQFGIVGWRIEARPRFYMPYTYLAWSFLHSNKPDAGVIFREQLARNSARAFHTEHHLVSAFCVVEQLAFCCGQGAGCEWRPAAQRITEAHELFIECIENIRKNDEGMG